MINKIFNNLSVIIPSFNEAKTVNKVIDEVLKLNEINEVILVDDGSTDSTKQKIKRYLDDLRFKYIKHARNKGKGWALKSGIKEAKNEIILLLDADLQNLNTNKLRKIINPVLSGEVDLSRAGFRLARGRVTEIAVKPMMRILFPGIYFDQPISGQVCAKKSFLDTLNLETKWGVDIGILLDAIQAGQRIVEVDIGELVHKARPDQEKAEMAEQVLETMIKKAGLIQHKYKLVVFTLDNTLIQGNTIAHIFKKLNLNREYETFVKNMNQKENDFGKLVTQFAKKLKNLDIRNIEKICDEVNFIKYAEEVIHALKKRKYQVAIISSNFTPFVLPIAKKLGIDHIESISLETKNNKITGNIAIRSHKWLEKDLEDSFEKTFIKMLQYLKIKPLETVMVANSPKCLPLFFKCGLSIAFKAEDKILKELADKTASILPEILAIME